MAKGDRWSDNQDVEVREMRNAETVLGVIRHRPLESRGEIERLKPGSEGGGWKRAAEATRWPPTLLHVWICGSPG